MPTNTDKAPDDVIRARKTKTGIKFEVAAPEVPKEPEPTPATVYNGNTLVARTQAEIEAGRARVQANEEARAKAPPRVIPDREKKATGSSTPVFRPGDFAEYAQNFKSPAVAKSKDM